MNWGYELGTYTGTMAVLAFSSVGSTGWFGDGHFETPNSSLGKKENKLKDTMQVKKT